MILDNYAYENNISIRVRKILRNCSFRTLKRDLVAFVQLKKREKHPWRSANFSKVAGFILHGSFSRFLNCTNDTKSRNASQMVTKQISFRTNAYDRNK